MTIALLSGLTAWVPSVAQAQVTDTLEIDSSGDRNSQIDADGDATLLHPPNTPRIKASAVGAAPSVSVTTYHFNNRRNGWNNAEPLLNPANVSSSNFNLLQSVSLDEQVDAQPLILANQAISGQGTHDVVYVVTENNTIYAIDAGTGAVLLTRSLGQPIPIQSLPGQCNNNGAAVGVNSTPVIDPATRVMYVMAYALEGLDGKTPTYRLHALDPGTLMDISPSQVVSASHKLSDGSVYTFQASVARQRAALLAVNGNIYAGFASFCDFSSDKARGWILGWNAKSLAPLAANNLDDLAASSPNNYYLTSVWMSGYGLAAEGSGNLMFVTGNSDPAGTAYSPKLNLSESAVKIALDLSIVKDFFTPSNVASLEQGDGDLGSGGLMALPTQPGPTPYLLVAGGKDGRMFLLNRTGMGSYNAGGPNNVVGTYQMGRCWCGPSYFGGSDGVGRVVSSGGQQIMVWRLQTSPSTGLVQERVTTQLPATVQDDGSFTTISSNGTQAGTAVIWTVRRPVDRNRSEVTLYAFDASTGATLASRVAGTWPNLGGNANIVPVAANGKVYVASYKQLAIFGVGPAGITVSPHIAIPGPALTAPHRVSGTVVSFSKQTFTIRTRTGRPVNILSTEAFQLHQAVPLVVGTNVQAEGSYDATGTLLATTIFRAKQPDAWAPDQ